MTEETRMILDKLERMEEKLNSLDNKVTYLDEKVSCLDEKVTCLDEKVTCLDEKVTCLDEKVSDLDEKVTCLDTRVSEMDERFTKDIREIKITLEREVNRNIAVIAEGHLSLDRKLDEALKVNQEREMLLLRVNRLETELLKRREH
ncbi:hypothetical protein D1155_02665 [Anaerotruncus sp. 80]|uniref:Chromosome segregation protein n=1 Tax=Anaerotruncus colihominis TaxID=169435 RepID=A0A845QGR5_9FIRM|nr:MULTISPECIES: hypothetical protein [Anaerotruncus]MCI9639141.1 hypothetical protein [Emergencia sp.]NBH60574.1 hypothetical protein [Anaerotruncus colihominis]NCF01228.1 hypothetical protein [Anaerotruncus sp. 80]